MYSETLKLLRKKNYSLVILGASVNSVKVKWGSSEVFRVIKSTNCPVISYCGETQVAGIKEILLPLSESSNTRQKVAYCATLAKVFDSTVHIYGISKSERKKTQKTIGSYIRQTERYLSERGIKYSVDTNFGVKVPRAIIAYSMQVKAGLVFAMTDTESTGIFSKSYAEQLFVQCNIPIMWVHFKDTTFSEASGY